MIEDLDNIIQDFKTKVRYITKSIPYAHFNERTDKIVVYFCGCSFSEIQCSCSALSVCFPLA